MDDLRLGNHYCAQNDSNRVSFADILVCFSQWPTTRLIRQAGYGAREVVARDISEVGSACLHRQHPGGQAKPAGFGLAAPCPSLPELDLSRCVLLVNEKFGLVRAHPLKK